MALDEQATVTSLDAARDAFAAAIRNHNGRVIDMAGDSVLAVFETAGGAVSAALDVQQNLEVLATGAPADRRMRFRIGVHLGDIIEKADGSIYGDGVNIAARLQGLALPGGITVSDAVRGSVRNRLAATFEDLGDQQVKNIADPVRAFRVARRAGGIDTVAQTLVTEPQGSRLHSLRWRRWMAGVVICGAVAVAGLLVWGPGGHGAAGDPPLLSVAVLPFKAANGVAPDSLTQSFTQAVTAGLSQTVLGKHVVSADTVAAYRGELGDVRAVGKDLNVRYLVQGDIHREDGQVLVTAQLVDAQSRAQTWSTRINVPVAGAASFPELAVFRILNAVRRALYQAEVQRLPSESAHNASPTELAFRGLYKAARGSKEAFEKRKELCDAALRLDPTLTAALLCKAATIEQVLFSPGVMKLDPKRVAELDELTRQAVAADRDDSDAWGYRASALRWQLRWDATSEARARAIQLAPFSSRLYLGRAWDLIYMGLPAKAQTALAEAADVDPDILRNDNYLSAICRAHLSLGQFDEAIASCEKAAGGGGGEDGGTQIFLAVAYAQMGQTTKAMAARDRAVSLLQGLTIASWRELCSQFSDTAAYWEQQERYILPGMRKAGFHEN